MAGGPHEAESVTEAQILEILRAAQAGEKIADLLRRHGVRVKMPRLCLLRAQTKPNQATSTATQPYNEPKGAEHKNSRARRGVTRLRQGIFDQLAGLQRERLDLKRIRFEEAGDGLATAP